MDTVLCRNIHIGEPGSKLETTEAALFVRKAGGGGYAKCTPGLIDSKPKVNKVSEFLHWTQDTVQENIENCNIDD